MTRRYVGVEFLPLVERLHTLAVARHAGRRDESVGHQNFHGLRRGADLVHELPLTVRNVLDGTACGVRRTGSHDDEMMHVVESHR